MVRQTEYTITFNANQGTCSPEEMTTDATGVISEFPTATRAGYSFTGWYTAPSDGTEITSTTFTKNTILYAHWKQEYTITFDANNGSCSTGSSQTVDGKLSELPIATRSGYSFTGWFTASTGGTEVTESYEFNADATVYAQWTALPGFTVTFDPEGGSCSVTEMSTDTDGRLSSLPEPTYQYHDFDGWFTASTGGTEVTESYVFDGDTTVYAHWSVYMVTYDHGMLADATGDSDSIRGLDTGMEITEGATYQKLSDTAGYRHTGWDIDGRIVGPTSDLVESTPHTAKSVWTRITYFIPVPDNRADPEIPIVIDQTSDGRDSDQSSSAAVVAAGCVIVLLAILVLTFNPRFKN